ncbi:MAG: tRNA (adenosine(37)-N6)-threonylcarbamoyltransferase complex dimerization subunit type 1 TsaB [Parcubacteria group bacterium]
MRILAVDTCLPACSAAVIDGNAILAAASEPMVKGHQERLATMVREVTQHAGVGFADLDRIAVTVGPGSFTGLRVGVAFAKGLASALGVPCVGVGTLEALAAEEPGVAAAVVDAKRGQVYLQVFEDGRALTEPEALPLDEAAARLVELRPTTLVGSGAPLLAPALPGARVDHRTTPDPAAIARIAAKVGSPEPVKPLYLHAPDARPSAA